MYGASIETPRNRFVGANTVKASLCRCEATAFQLEASAHAPWTRTIVGLGMSYSIRSSDHGGHGEDRVVDRIVSVVPPKGHHPQRVSACRPTGLPTNSMSLLFIARIAHPTRHKAPYSG